MAQWQELEVHACIFRHMIAGAPVPPQLLHLVKKSLILNSHSFSPYYQSSPYHTAWKMLIRHLRRGILLVTHSVMRARMKNYRGGTDVHPKSGCLNRRTSGIKMIDWVIFTVSTSKNQLRMEGYLSWIRYGKETRKATNEGLDAA